MHVKSAEAAQIEVQSSERHEFHGNVVENHEISLDFIKISWTFIKKTWNFCCLQDILQSFACRGKTCRVGGVILLLKALKRSSENALKFHEKSSIFHVL